MIQNMVLAISLIEVVIIVYLVQNKKRLQKQIRRICTNHQKEIMEKENKIQQYKSAEQKELITNLNFEKMINSIHEINKDVGKGEYKYTNMYCKEIEKGSEKQVVFIVYYAYGGYFLNEALKYQLRCKVFVDGVEYEPIIPDTIHKEITSFYLDINLGSHSDKGVGSFVLETLTQEVKKYPQIQTIRGRLSRVDYRNKEQLIHFYSKNGFDKIIPMTEDNDGLIVKYLQK